MTTTRQKPVILASSSPRRKEILARMGVDFEVVVSNADENVQGTPESVVLELARRKARAVAERYDDRLVLGADTIVVIGDTILGKPKNPVDAARMLGMLSGRWHNVFTGVCLIDTIIGEERTALDCARVKFAPLEARSITQYVSSGEPMGKAGAYAIQGQAGMFIERLDGSPSCVMGLPMAATRVLLRQVGYDII